jgi:hypothetical protein
MCDPRAEPSDPFAAFVFGLVDGKTSVGDVIDAAGMTEADGMKIIRAMVDRRELRIKR